MVIFSAETLNATGEKPELNTQLDHQADVMEGQRFERRDKLGQIIFSADGARHKNPAHSGGGQTLGPSQNLLSVDRGIISSVVAKFWLGDQLLDRIPDLRMDSVQQKLQVARFESRRFSFDGWIAASRARRDKSPFAGG